MSGISYSNYYSLMNTSSLLSQMTQGMNTGNLAKLSSLPTMNSINNASGSNKLYNQLSQQADRISQLQQYNKEASAFNSKFDSAMSSLSSSANSLKSYSSTSVFNPTGYGSDNGSVASVTADKTNSSAPRNPIGLDVKQTAQAQAASSAALNSSGKSLAGKSTLTLTGQDGKTTKLNFDIAYGTDNKTALQKMAEQINGAKAGVTAKVVEKDGKSSLSIVSDETGTESAFEAKLTGSAASTVDLQTTQTAQNAVYTVDGGKEQISQSNNIKLNDNALEVTLKSAGSVQLGPSTKDSTQVVDAVKKFASDYNDALSLTASYSSKSSALSSLAYSLGSSRLSSNALSEIGINVNSSGKLSVDASKLAAVLKSDPNKVKDTLGGPNGFASETYNTTVNAKSNARSMFPVPSGISALTSTYNRNMDFITSYLGGMYMNTMI